MAKKTLTAEEVAKQYEEQFGGSAAVDGHAVMRAIFAKNPGVVPQVVGIDGFKNTGEDGKGERVAIPATEDSPILWNNSGITQAIYKQTDPSTPIFLLPGDCAVGLEFMQYEKSRGGTLTLTRPADSEVRVLSKRDAAYFQIRREMDGTVAERVGKFKLQNEAKLDPIATSPKQRNNARLSGGR